MIELVNGFLVRRRQDRWRSRWLRLLGDCPQCGHPWPEHAGTGNDLHGVCGECAYEFERDHARVRHARLLPALPHHRDRAVWMLISAGQCTK